MSSSKPYRYILNAESMNKEGLIMKVKSITLFFVVFFSSYASHLWATSVAVEYIATTYSDEKKVQQKLARSILMTDLVKMLNENFRLLYPVTIRFGAAEGPLYNPDKHYIDIPYSFVVQVKQRFDQDNYQVSGVSVEQATTDALMHTVLHEMGHLLIEMYQLPVLGREEDAVDSLATMLLLESFNEGAEIAISAADLFALESEDVSSFEAEDFWDEHSLDEQRYYTTLCHIFASAPGEYQGLLQEVNMPQSRREQCIEEYGQVRESWQILLSPYLTGGVLSY